MMDSSIKSVYDEMAHHVGNRLWGQEQQKLLVLKSKLPGIKVKLLLGVLSYAGKSLRRWDINCRKVAPI